MFEYFKDIGTYETRKVGRTEVNGLTISTAYTSDEGYETALLDTEGAHPVERYSCIEDARLGHEKWCKEAETIKTVTMLGGLGGLVPDEVITLSRSTEKESGASL
jgi:hypothetical protein